MTLEMLEELCNIIELLSDIVYKQGLIIEHSKVEEEVKKEMREYRESVQKKIDDGGMKM